uniref:WAP domain-containing protein n=1 Tax=Gouania willdenowi TaxID=441366 RepID=A0A8C5G008_GOUWI
VKSSDVIYLSLSDKPGTCPAKDPHYHSPQYSSSPNCDRKDKCNIDFDCQDDKKCCSFRCGTECVDPHQGKQKYLK